MIPFLILPTIAVASDELCEKAREDARVQVVKNTKLMEHFRTLCKMQRGAEIERCAAHYAMRPIIEAERFCASREQPKE